MVLAGRRGFTFVELLIAATMISILFVGLSSHLRGGMTVWQQTTQRTAALQRERVAFERMERDLANAFVYDPTGRLTDVPALAAGANRLSWATIEPAGHDHPARARVVAYACGEQQGRLGLWRTTQSLSEARAKRLPTAEFLLPGCDELAVRYAYLPAGSSGALEWEGEWHKTADRLPALVEVSVRAGGHRSQRTLRVPVGVLEPFNAMASP